MNIAKFIPKKRSTIRPVHSLPLPTPAMKLKFHKFGHMRDLHDYFSSMISTYCYKKKDDIILQTIFF